MNELVQAERGKLAVSVSDSTKLLIRSGVSENTIRAYGRALANLSEWLDGQVEAFHIDNGGNGLYRPHDAALAEYITALHEAGKSPSTISQAVVAVRLRGLYGRKLNGYFRLPKPVERWRICVIQP